MKPAVTDYLPIEAALQTRLLQEWRQVGASLYRRMLPFLLGGEYDKARKLASTIDLGPIAKKNREYIKAILWKALEFGAKQAAADHTTFVGYGEYRATLNKVADLFIASFVLNATKQVYESAMHSIANIEEAHKQGEVLKKEKPRFVKEFVSFQNEGDDMVKLVSSLHTSRLAVWGFTAEAEVRGIDKYKLTAVLDDRTSEFCRFIDGKEFDVADARKKIVASLSAENPDDLKTLAPWPNQNKASMASYAGMTNDQLAALGFSVPPFHPGCRTICTLVTKPSAEVAPAKAPVNDPQSVDRATPESFDELHLTATQPQIDHWNRTFTETPVEVLSSLSGKEPLDLLGDPIAGAIKFQPQGAISLKDVAPLGDGLARINMVFDPYRERMFLNYAEFKDAPPMDVAGYLRNLYQRAVELAKPAGLVALEVRVSGALGAFTHAKMGFAPSESEWASITTDIKADLPALNLSPMQEKMVTALLDSGPKAIWTLAELNTKVDGVPLGQLLLKDKKFNTFLNLEDANAMERLGWYL